MPSDPSQMPSPREQIAEILAVTLLEMLIRQGTSDGDVAAAPTAPEPGKRITPTTNASSSKTR